MPALEQLEKIGWISREAVIERPAVRTLTERVYRLAHGLDLDAWRERLRRAPRRRALLESLSDEPQTLRASPALNALVKAGAVRVEADCSRCLRKINGGVPGSSSRSDTPRPMRAMTSPRVHSWNW